MKTLDQIAAQLQGYDPQAMSAQAVTAFLTRMVPSVAESDFVEIFASLGRVLAQDLISPIHVPGHDNSAMDGYAFDGRQLVVDAPLSLAVVGTALAGRTWGGTLQAGECLKIMTGATMPAGTDTVVPQEFVTLHPAPRAADGAAGNSASTLTIPAGVVVTGDNRRLAGEDIRQGQVALSKGERLSPAALGLAASLGIKTVPVWRQLKVAYFSTGNEILSLGDAPRDGAVYDSNRYTVFGLLTRLGIEVIDLGVVPDEPLALEAAFRHAAARADAIITSGGVSVGEADHTKSTMRKLAGHAGGVAFWRIAMRPGRPMAVGLLSRQFQEESIGSPRQLDKVSYQNSSDSPTGVTNAQNDVVLFGLPGNPVAVMVTFLAFVRPALLRMMGSTEIPPPYLKAQSLAAIRKKPGRTEYQRGMVSTWSNGDLQVQLTGNQGSGVLSSMVQANGLIVLHHDQGDVATGDWVDVMMFDGVV